MRNHIISCTMSLDCRLKYPYRCFSFHRFLDFLTFLLFCCYLLLLVAAVIGLSLILFIYSSSCIDLSMQSSMMASPLPLSFLGILVNQCHLLSVRPCASLTICLFFGPPFRFPTLSTLRRVQTIWQKKSRCSWCNGYRRRKWTRRHGFKSWKTLFAFHIALILLGKVWLELLLFQPFLNFLGVTLFSWSIHQKHPHPPLSPPELSTWFQNTKSPLSSKSYGVLKN